MKKVILGSVLAIAAATSANAATASVCSAGASGNVAAATSNFVRVGFTSRCSTNTIQVADDNGSYFRSGAVSLKGKNAFGASSNGGGVQGVSCANTTQCTLTDAASGATSAASS